MSRYNAETRVIEPDPEDEVLMPEHFDNARRAWAKKKDMASFNQYHLKKTGR